MPADHTPPPVSDTLFTTAVHSGQTPLKPGVPSAPPIVTATGWTHADMRDLDAALSDEDAGYVYTRNAAPTQEAFEAAVAALEAAGGAASFASGLAALHAALLVAGAERPGTAVVAASELYGATQTLLKKMAVSSNLTLHWVNIRDLAEVEAALDQATGGVLLFEVLSNPLCRVADAPALVDLAHRHGCQVVIDSTFTTPYLIRPVTFGADFVMHSATKYLGGHGDVLAGVVAASAENALALRRARKLLGSNLSPFEAYLALRGLRTLPLRVREQNHNALALAQWLAQHPRVARVHYSGLPDNPDHAVARRILRAGCFGAMLAFDLQAAGRPEAFAFLDKLALIQRISSLGDVATLASYPPHASHRALTPEQRAALDIGEGCVRLSVGIEAADDLMADLDQALRH